MHVRSFFCNNLYMYVYFLNFQLNIHDVYLQEPYGDCVEFPGDYGKFNIEKYVGRHKFTTNGLPIPLVIWDNGKPQIKFYSSSNLFNTHIFKSGTNNTFSYFESCSSRPWLTLLTARFSKAIPCYDFKLNMTDFDIVLKQ